MISNLLRNDDADIFVHFTSGDATNAGQTGLARFVAGDAVVGYVEITPAKNIPYKKLSLRIKWRTEGRGDTDEVVWYTVEEPDGTLTAGIMKTLPFSAVLPEEPWSFAGRYITIVWGVDIEVDVAWAINLRHFAPFVLAPAWGNASER